MDVNRIAPTLMAPSSAAAAVDSDLAVMEICA